MKLIIVLVLFALFAHTECSNSENFSTNLSPASQNSIRSILENHSGITEPEAFIANINELGRTFSLVDEQGSIQLAETFVQAYSAMEISESEIQNLMKEAVRVGNVNVYIYFSKNIPYSNFDVLEIAASNGQLDIIVREFAIIKQRNKTFKNDSGKIVSAAIQAGHLHVLRWLSEKGVLFNFDAKKFILEALETQNQEIIDYLLQAKIYTNHQYPTIQFNFKDCLLNNDYVPDSICREAAKIGNMDVVRYFFNENLPIIRSDLERAQIAAYKAGHTEIADLIGNQVLENLKLRDNDGFFYCRDVTEALIAALEGNNQKVIDYLLNEEIYSNPYNRENRLAYKDNVRLVAFSRLEEVFIKAAEFGNMGVVRYYFDEYLPIKRSDLERAQMAAYKAGKTEISDLIGNRVFKILQSCGYNGLLSPIDVKEALIAALEVKHQRVFDYLLHEPIYPDIYDNEIRLTYEEFLPTANYFEHEEIFMKAAEVGNMEVFQYYFEREFFKDKNYLREVQQIALKNGHNDIADSISTTFMF